MASLLATLQTYSTRNTVGKPWEAPGSQKLVDPAQMSPFMVSISLELQV